MKKLTRAETAEFLMGKDHFVILSHVRPDGDTVGSSAALCLGLRRLGKTAHVLYNPGVSPRFAWLHQDLTVDRVEQTDTVVSTDVASPAMLPPEFEYLKDRVALRIDHHGSATSFTDYELVDAQSASCAELVWDVLEAMGCPAERNIMDAVYVGLSTDTGCFRFANTTPHTFRVAAVCAENGARVFALNQELFETNTLAKLKMRGWMVDHMRLLKEGALAICSIPRAVELELGVTGDDMDNISNFPRTVAGVNLAATLRETEEGVVKMSIRAVPGYDAAAVAERFGGGGHKGAAGGIMKGLKLEDAAKALEDVIMELYG